jgi:hypothetical protein
VYERFLLKVFNSLFSTSHTAALAYYIIQDLPFSVESHRKVKPMRTNPVWEEKEKEDGMQVIGLFV